MLNVVGALNVFFPLAALILDSIVGNYQAFLCFTVSI